MALSNCMESQPWNGTVVTMMTTRAFIELAMSVGESIHRGPDGHLYFIDASGTKRKNVQKRSVSYR